MSQQDGQEGKLYLLTTPVSAVPPVSGVYAAVPAGNEVLGIRDVSLNGTTLSSFDTTARNDYIGTDGRNKPKFSLTLNILDRTDSASFIDTFQTAHITGEELPIAVLDGDKAASMSRGLISNFQVHNFTNGQPMGDVGTYDVEIRPSSFPGIKRAVSA